ncbi:DUF885 domain-containing protein [Asticcacaulis taihuensis]|uniref:Uncharacterized conserved protein, DUF885 familyt n=1 Tax=Asticcacaulis taihuensis TaxID=260084 RepID=A0A1G4QGQ3_9CAUL|nr:DUF885 family protein [Asticcacaulis taihuensis]SCW43625.1 Uncharacterized conserved protein, DUF885 familyt [Asticcacaulis taihuensis]
MKALLHATALTVILTSLSALPALADTATDQKFESIYKSEWDWRSQQEAANEDSPSGEVAAHLPDVSEKAQTAKLARWQDTLKQLDAIDVKALSPKDAEDYQVYRFQIETLIADQQFKVYQRPLSGDTSFWGDLAGMARGTFHSESDYRNYIAQLNDMPRYFKDNTDNMRAGLKRGFTLPQISLQGRDATITSVTDAKSVEDNIYYTPFKSLPATIPADKQAELKKLAADAITKSVLPAHKTLLKFMREEYIPGAAKSIAAYDLPNGKAFYQSQVREYATVDMTPEQIHQIGLDEVAKIKAEMLAIKDQVGFKGDLPAFNDFLRTDPQFYVTTPQALLDRAAWTAKEFDGKASQYFGRLPRSRFGIIPVPDDIAPFYTGGRGGPGVYLVNTWNLPSRPLYSLPALTLHESAPGHAFQMPLAAENTDLPPFRQFTYISAYGEGWALYSERLGVEMGMYHTPYETYGMLSYQMWRACRLVVDTGIHAKGWTREQAQNYLLENTALSKHEVTTEVDRYIAWPGQALSYYLGEMAIWKARHKAEAALGEKFDLRQFHDAVLQLGSVPLPVLEARVDRFIAEGGKGPYADEK